MRLYCDATSKKAIGYVPEWLRIYFFTEAAMKLPEEEREYSYVTFDLQGEIDYDVDTLSCRVKGELIPWVKCIDGDESDFANMKYDELIGDAVNKKIIEMIQNAQKLGEATGTSFITIGIYPIEDDDDVWDKAEDDEFTDCKAELILNGCEPIKFTFDTQLNNE